MSLLQALRIETQPISPSSPPRVAFQGRDVRVSAPPKLNQDTQDASTEHDLRPRPEQLVFEQAPVIRTTQTRKVSIIALLVLANVVQVHILMASLYRRKFD